MEPQPAVLVERPAVVLLDFAEDIEDVRKILKEEAESALAKTSEQAKTVMKQQADALIAPAVDCAVSPIKCVNNLISPAPCAGVANLSVDYCVKPTCTKIAHRSIDRCVDSAAKKAIHASIDRSVNSTASFFASIYNFFHRRCASTA